MVGYILRKFTATCVAPAENLSREYCHHSYPQEHMLATQRHFQIARTEVSIITEIPWKKCVHLAQIASDMLADCVDFGMMLGAIDRAIASKINFEKGCSIEFIL